MCMFSSRVALASSPAMSFSMRPMSRPISLAAAAEQLLMELEVLLAGRVLHAHRDRDLRRLDRARPEHREFLEHDPGLWVLHDQVELVVGPALPPAAVVIEELDQRPDALVIADRDLGRRVEQGLT